MIKIDNIGIGPDHPPYIIAEMSGNHDQSLDRALEIVDTASKCGASAIKLQTYTADTLTIDVKNDYFKISDPGSLWKNNYLYDLYNKAYTPWEWHKPIMERARKHGITCFSSPFDETAVDFLEDLNVPAYKIASFENNHLPLIKKVASTGKPLIISTGLASLEEINEAVDCAKSNGCSNIVLLKCTSAYPASPKDSNILTIPDLHEKTGCLVGLSDHTLGIGVAIAAVAHGAVIIEKHLTLSKEDDGVDSEFSISPPELTMLVTEATRSWQSLGVPNYTRSEQEEKSVKFRRSIFITNDLQKGSIINENDIRIIRPGYGLSPKYFEQLIGKELSQPVKKGTPASWDLFDDKFK